MRKALFLDRDGTLIIDQDYLSDPTDVVLLPGVKEALHRAIHAGYLLFLFTNQSGIGRGYFTLADAEACNLRMLDLLELPSPGFTEICIAPEHPDVPAVYRKPSPRFILEMISRYQIDPRMSWMIGDRQSDVAAGMNAGVCTALLDEAGSMPLPVSALRYVDLAAFTRAQLITT